MEIKILDSILHSSLKPWKIDKSKTKRLAELIKAEKAVSSKTSDALHVQLKILLQDHPEFMQIIETDPLSNSIRHPFFKAQLPAVQDTTTQFYDLLVNYELIRLYNTLLTRSATWKEPVDFTHRVGNTLDNIKVLGVQTAEELRDRNFTTIPDEQSDHIHYTLYILKHSLIALYFSIQKVYAEYLTPVFSLEDFYMLELEEPKNNIVPLKVNKDADFEEMPLKKRENKQPRLTFGFNGDKGNLKKLINELCIQINLLNEELSPADELLQILLSRNIKPGEIAIHLNCDNKNFRYVIERLGPDFNSLSFINIEHAKSFYSRGGKLLVANDFSKAKSFSPKLKADIDNIFKEMQ